MMDGDVDHLTKHFNMLNKRLDATQFVSHPADVSYYGQLVAEVRRLNRPGDKLNIPDYQGAFAWRRLFTVFRKLKERGELKPDAAAIERARRFAADQSMWNSYIDYRERFLRELLYNRVDKRVLEYIGLEDDDLGEPTQFDRQRWLQARVPNWMDRLQRLEEAWTTLRSMSATDKKAIPHVMAARRAEAAAASLAERVARLEEEAHA